LAGCVPPKTYCLSGVSPVGCVVLFCSEKPVSSRFRSLLCFTSVPHTGSSSTNIQLLHFSGVTCWGLFFVPGLPKGPVDSHVLVCASGRSSLSFPEHPCIFHSRSTTQLLYPPSADVVRALCAREFRISRCTGNCIPWFSM